MRKLFLILSAMLCLLISAIAQNRTVTGKVTDENGQPIQNASVLVKGTRIGTTTNSDGSFSLNVPASAKTLLVSSVNSSTQEVAITGRTVNVALAVRATSMEEVIVTGYGTPQQRRNTTASVGKVNGKELENKPYSSVDQMLTGKVAGLVAPTTTGQPGAAQAIRIRGIGSIGAGSNPLFVVDGVIVNQGDFSRLTQTANVLAGLNPNDIEDVTVLKDAQGKALYGSRGSNGVILITTKSGKAGKTKIDANVEAGYSDRANYPENARYINGQEWLTLFEEGLKNAGYSQSVIDQQTALYGKGSGVSTNWDDLVTRRGNQQTYSISASGGEGKTTFFVSGGYYNQEGVIIASDFKRYSANARIRHTSNKLMFEVKIGGSNSIEHAPFTGGAFANPIPAFLLPTQYPYNADGTFNISRAAGYTGFASTFNPLYLAKYDQHNLNTVQLSPTVNVEYSILKSLKFSQRYGIDYSLLDEYRYDNPFHGNGRTTSGAGFAGISRLFGWTSTSQLIYNAFVDKARNFKLDATIGYEASKNTRRILDAGANNFPPTTDLTLSTAAATVTNGKVQQLDWAFNSVFSLATVSYKNKYVVNGSFRRDGSSRFSLNHQYGNFWAVGGAWNVEQESFFAGISKIFNRLKVYGSYGLTGNAEIANYGWRQTFGYGGNYNGLPGGTFNTIGNSEVTWESSRETNIGLDFGILKDRIGLRAEYYKRNITGLLFNDPLSPTTGFPSVTRNIGAMQNTGYELTLNATPVRYKDFTWNLSFNLSHNTNKITKLPGHKDIIDNVFLLREGLDYRTYYGRVYVGVDPATGDPQWYKDSTHKDIVTNRSLATREPLKGMSASPKYTGGFSSTFNWKGLSLTTDFVYNFGNYVYDSWAFYTVDGADPLEGKYALNLQRWQKPGDITSVPKMVYGTTNGSSSFSTRFLQKGDYIRLRNIELGYNLTSNSILSKLHVNNVRLYVRGTNLWTKTYDKNLTIDPEQGVNGAANNEIYYSKTITFGAHIGF